MNRVQFCGYCKRLFRCGKRVVIEIPQFCRMTKEFGIKQSIDICVSHILPFRKRREGLNDRLCLYLEAFLSDLIEKANQETLLQGNKANLEWPVWICWFNGIENAPEIVKACFASVKKNLPSQAKLHVITLRNYTEYFALPSYCIEKFERGAMTPAALSDIFRACLLSKYGGLWLDATIFISNPIAEEILKSSYFTLKAEKRHPYWSDPSEGKWCGFIWNTEPNNLLFIFLRDALLKYWNEYNVVIEYLLPDYIIKVAYDNIPVIKKMIDEFPCNINDVWLCMRSMGETYSDDLWHRIKINSTYNKITYKKAWETIDQMGNETLFGHILKQYSLND